MPKQQLKQAGDRAQRMIQGRSAASAGDVAGDNVVRLASANEAAPGYSSGVANETSVYQSYLKCSRGARGILCYIMVLCGESMECHIRCFDIQTAVGVSPSTVYRGLEKLEKYGFLTRRKFRDGAYQCLEIKLKPTCLKLWKYSEVQRVASSFDHSSGGAVTTSSLPRLDRQKEDYLSEAAKELLSLTEEDFEARFPRLVESHFGPQNLMQIVHELSSEGKPLELIMDSLEYANFDIEMGQFVDGKGKEVGSKSGYLYIALRNSYQYPRPSNYISKEELAAQEAEKRLEEVRSAIKRKEDAMYNIWLEGLSKEDKVQVESTLLSLPGPKHRRYRPYWEEHVKGKEDQVRTSCLEASACSGEDSQVDQRQKPDKEHGEAPLASKTYPQQE